MSGPVITGRRIAIDVPRTGPDGIRAAHDGLGEADGVIPDGVTVFDDKVPACRQPRPRSAQGPAQSGDGRRGRRGRGRTSTAAGAPRAYQDQLLREAVSEYGSEEEAARWVATPTRPRMCRGTRSTSGLSEATAWLSEHGAEYGLCQIYRNEPWHYELRPGAVDHGCPPMYADPTHDPRTRD